MEYRFIGRTGVRVSALALGTMSFGGDADEATASAIFNRAREVGINHFDTADVYNAGRSEEILGRLVAGCRDEVLIATKAYFPTSDDVNARGASRYHLVRAVEASLRRLGTDRIDLFYLHRFDDMTALDESLRALDDLVRQGKILYLAASNFAAWQVARALGVSEAKGLAPLVCVQPMYNLAKRQAEVEILPMARSENLAVFSYSPLAGGLLSGKYGSELRPEAGRLIDNKMYATRYGHASNYAIADRLCALARERGVHPASLAIAWVASRPGITAPLIGGRSLEQIEPALAAMEISIDEELETALAEVSTAPPPATDRNEEKTAHNYGSR